MRTKSIIPTLGTSSGALILVFGLFLFSIQDMIIKHFSDHYSVLQVVYFRGLIAMALMLLFLIMFNSTIPLMSQKPVNKRKQEQPHDVDEMPVPTGRFECEMIVRREMTAQHA